MHTDDPSAPAVIVRPMPASVASSVDSLREMRLRRATLALIILLLAQFALGIAANLYATVPAHHPGAHTVNFFTGSLNSIRWALGHTAPVLAAHTALGLLIVLAAIGLLVQAVYLSHRRTLVAAALGMLLVIGAGFNGASFLDFGNDVNSLIMSLLFALATACYVAILYIMPIRFCRSAR